MNEKELQAVVQRSIAYAYQGNSKMRVTHPDMYEGAGKPDLVGHILGLHVEIELKVSYNKPSPQQVLEIATTNSTGGLAVYIVYHKVEGKFYIVRQPDFRWRDKREWLVLEKVRVGSVDMLDLRPLTALLRIQKGRMVF